MLPRIAYWRTTASEMRRNSATSWAVMTSGSFSVVDISITSCYCPDPVGRVRPNPRRTRRQRLQPVTLAGQADQEAVQHGQYRAESVDLQARNGRGGNNVHWFYLAWIRTMSIVAHLRAWPGPAGRAEELGHSPCAPVCRHLSPTSACRDAGRRGEACGWGKTLGTTVGTTPLESCPNYLARCG